MKTFFKYIKNNIKFTISLCITVIAISSLSACVTPFSDRARSERLFEQYCNEEGRVGQFIYERVALGEEYFRSIPTDQRELDRISSSYYLENKTLLIDKERFKQSYSNLYERKLLTSIGPIYSLESTIVRKSDGKVLSKAVSLFNMLDKSSKYFHVEGEYCPAGRDSRGMLYHQEKHITLIKNTFFKQD